jgi:hypothetical protein
VKITLVLALSSILYETASLSGTAVLSLGFWTIDVVWVADWSRPNPLSQSNLLSRFRSTQLNQIVISCHAAPTTVKGLIILSTKKLFHDIITILMLCNMTNSDVIHSIK